MGWLNIEYADGHIETICNGEIVEPAASVFHDPRITDYKSPAQAALEVGMGDGSWPPQQPPRNI